MDFVISMRKINTEEQSGLASPVKLAEVPALTDDERERGRVARLEVSQRLGYNRIQVTSTYVGVKSRCKV